jgi:hypothetical protein
MLSLRKNALDAAQRVSGRWRWLVFLQSRGRDLSHRISLRWCLLWRSKLLTQRRVIEAARWHLAVFGGITGRPAAGWVRLAPQRQVSRAAARAHAGRVVGRASGGQRVRVFRASCCARAGARLDPPAAAPASKWRWGSRRSLLVGFRDGQAPHGAKEQEQPFAHHRVHGSCHYGSSNLRASRSL